MKYGAPFLGAFALKDPKEIQTYVQAVEELGFSHLFMDEILLNDDPDNIYHESLTFFAYLAGLTKKIIFVPGIMVLPKRQTLLVARQAAEVDVLSGGRLRLGVGVGWKKTEFEALGIDFDTRGKRIDEQIRLMQLLWANEKITFQGQFHQIENIGINLLPINHSIPIWMGGSANIVLRRAARLANGWIADESVAEDLQEKILSLHAQLKQYGKNPLDFKIVKYLQTNKITRRNWASTIRAWEEIGVTHVVVLPSSGWETSAKLEDRLKELQIFANDMGLSQR